MLIQQDGKVGIGTTSPNTPLEVTGGISTTSSDFVIASTGERLLLQTAPSPYSYSKIQATSGGGTMISAALALQPDGGNVGIGTTSPDSKLHVDGNGNSIYAIFSRADTKWMYLHSGSVDPAIGWDTAGDLRFGTSTSNVGGGFSEKMRIDSSGKVGIGTTSPAQKLTINSGRMLVTNSTTPIYIKVNSSYKSWVHHISSDDGYIFAPSTADGGEAWDWANSTKLGANGVVTAKNFVLSSDERFKDNVKDIKDNEIKVAFKSFEIKSSPGEKRYGVIAQELEKNNPELVTTDTEGFKSVKYIDLLIAKIAELEARLEKLEK
jgi:hypothetical protein